MMNLLVTTWPHKTQHKAHASFLLSLPLGISVVGACEIPFLFTHILGGTVQKGARTLLKWEKIVLRHAQWISNGVQLSIRYLSFHCFTSYSCFFDFFPVLAHNLSILIYTQLSSVEWKFFLEFRENTKTHLCMGNFMLMITLCLFIPILQIWRRIWFGGKEEKCH